MGFILSKKLLSIEQMIRDFHICQDYTDLLYLYRTGRGNLEFKQ